MGRCKHYIANGFNMEYYIECPDKNYDLILTEYKEILLTQGKVALVDVEDYEWLNQWKWCANKNQKNGSFYAVRHIWKNNKYIISIHREIMKPPIDMEVDHINSNGLDNRRSNLRICFHYQNMINRGKNINNTSGYKGVHWHTQRKKWIAYITINYKQLHLGCFETKEQAALVYNEAAVKNFGDFAYQNKL